MTPELSSAKISDSFDAFLGFLSLGMIGWSQTLPCPQITGFLYGSIENFADFCSGIRNNWQFNLSKGLCESRVKLRDVTSNVR